jgi:hypothetical protein
MRWMLTALALFVQSAPLQPAYPRSGTTKLLENNRVIVWDITWLKQQYPLHRHPYDLAGVYYTDGDRTIVSEAGERRPVHTAAWDTAFQLKGVTHIEEGASDSPAAQAHRHQRDTVAIAFTGKSPKATFVARGTVHNDDAAAGADRVYVVKLK